MICSVLTERDWRFGEVQRDNSLFLQFFLQKASLGLVPQGSCYCLRLPPVEPTNQRLGFWGVFGDSGIAVTFYTLNLPSLQIFSVWSSLVKPLRSGAIDRGVIVFGTTVGPNYHRPEGIRGLFMIG